MTPHIRIVIPSRDHTLLRRCLKALDNQLIDPSEFSVVVVNNAVEPFREPSFMHVEVINNYNLGNFSSMCNLGVGNIWHPGGLLLFLNDDVVLAPEALGIMREAMTPDTVAVGSTLYYPSGEMQHAGVLFGADLLPGNLTDAFAARHHTTALEILRNSNHIMPATTGACLMVRRDDFLVVGGFDDAFNWAYEDVDLCLKLSRKGKIRVVETNSYHDESASGGARHLDMNSRLFVTRWAGRLEPSI